MLFISATALVSLLSTFLFYLMSSWIPCKFEPTVYYNEMNVEKRNKKNGCQQEE